MGRQSYIRCGIASVLLSALVGTSLASCARSLTPERTQSAKITAASSGAEDYRAWLSDRLDVIPDEVILGIGGSDRYGVDMADFEEDGYIIKRLGDTVAIFGATEDGLDRAVRKYANTVDAGAVVTDISYHEGYRIEEMRLFGRDISEYVIVTPADANANMKLAASEFGRLVEKACGAILTDGTSADPHKIEFRFSADESLGEAGYRYFEENGNLIFEGAVERGSLNGVYRFLQNECGWEGLIFGDSELAEAELVDIKTGLDRTETPIFNYLNVYNMFWGNYKTDRTTALTAEQNSYGPITNAGHGMQRNAWAGDGVAYDTEQICYTDDIVYDTVYDNIIKYIENKVAAGSVIGLDLRYIDISQCDNDGYCMCKNCSDMYSKEGAISGAVVRFANSLSEDVNKKYDSDLKFLIFGYGSSEKPPQVTRANDYVYVTVAQVGTCINHYLDGSACTPGEEESVPVTWGKWSNNIVHAENIKGWCEMADNLYYWHYALDSVLHQYTVLDTIYHDFLYMKEIGIDGLFWQIPYHGFGVKRVEQQIGALLNWQSDMTEAEYEEEICRLLEREYGDGWIWVAEYLKLLNEAQDAAGYIDCWLWTSPQKYTYDPIYMANTYEYMAECLEKAIRMAGSAVEEERCKLLSCHIYYDGTFSKYFAAYDAGDEEALAKLSAEYEFMIERVESLGFDISSIMTIDGRRVEVYPTLEEEAWKNWVKSRDLLADPTVERRPAPDWVIES